MSASSDYEELRRSRQERTQTQRADVHTRLAFVGCVKCGYFMGKTIPETEKADCICPNCGGQAVEV